MDREVHATASQEAGDPYSCRNSGRGKSVAEQFCLHPLQRGMRLFRLSCGVALFALPGGWSLIPSEFEFSLRGYRRTDGRIPSESGEAGKMGQGITGQRWQRSRRRTWTIQPPRGSFARTCPRNHGPVFLAGTGPQSEKLLTVASARSAAAAAAALARLVAIPAIDRSIATRLKRHCCRLAATRTNHRCSLCRSRTVAGTPLIVLLCHTAILATLRGRVTTFLKERLISSGEGKVLPAVTARKLNISGHGSPCGNCTAQFRFCT